MLRLREEEEERPSHVTRRWVSIERGGFPPWWAFLRPLRRELFNNLRCTILTRTSSVRQNRTGWCMNGSYRRCKLTSLTPDIPLKGLHTVGKWLRLCQEWYEVVAARTCVRAQMLPCRSEFIALNFLPVIARLCSSKLETDIAEIGKMRRTKKKRVIEELITPGLQNMVLETSRGKTGPGITSPLVSTKLQH